MFFLTLYILFVITWQKKNAFIRGFNKSTKDHVLSGREGTMDCFLHQFPKFYNNVFLFVGLLNFDWLVLLVECPNVSTTTNFNPQKGRFCGSSLGCKYNLTAIVLSLQIPNVLYIKVTMGSVKFELPIVYTVSSVFLGVS